MFSKHRFFCVLAVVATAFAPVAPAQVVLIDDNFETDTSANYTIATSDAANGSVTFAFDAGGHRGPGRFGGCETSTTSAGVARLPHKLISFEASKTAWALHAAGRNPDALKTDDVG